MKARPDNEAYQLMKKLLMADSISILQNMQSATAFDDESAESTQKMAGGWKDQIKNYTQMGIHEGHNRRYDWLN